MITDRVGDFIVRLQNAAAADKPVVLVPHSAHLEAIAKKLKELGYVEAVEVKGEVKKTIEIRLARDERGNPMIRGVRRISKPGRRLYTSHRDAHRVKGGTGARIISTPKGILSDAEVRKVRAGGEDLFQIW